MGLENNYGKERPVAAGTDRGLETVNIKRAEINQQLSEVRSHIGELRDKLANGANSPAMESLLAEFQLQATELEAALDEIPPQQEPNYSDNDTWSGGYDR